jgi:hypothetical protein
MKSLGIIRIALDINALTEAELDKLVTGIVENGPNSPLCANQVIKDCVTALSGAQTKYSAAHTDTVTATQKLETLKSNEAELRVTLCTTLIQLKGLVETTGKKPGDVTSMGFTYLDRAVQSMLLPPPGIDVFYPKKGVGRAKVTAQQTGPKKHYEAQVCTEPTLTTWADIDGYGKSHWLKGYKSGTTLWARYRTIRGHAKSDWTAPVAVTIP